jgi:hypothetical protein
MGCCKLTREGGRCKELISVGTFSKQRLQRQKGSEQVGDKPLPEIGQIEVHKAHVLNQWATSKVKQLCKIEKQSTNQHNMLTAGGWQTILWPCSRERNKPPIRQYSENSTPKQDGWWATEMFPRNWEQYTNSNCHTSLREELTKQLPLKDRKKTKQNWWVSPITWWD